MIFRSLKLDGAFLIVPEPHEDERGFLARTFCKQEFESHGLVHDFVQCNISYNEKTGTLRGMHYQEPPHAEVKIVRCTRGAVFDVIVDIRRDSVTYAQWHGLELSESNRHMLYVPQGFAHGFVTLADATEVFYMMSEVYDPGSARVLCWNDPVVDIAWPIEPGIISPRDQSGDVLPRL